MLLNVLSMFFATITNTAGSIHLFGMNPLVRTGLFGQVLRENRCKKYSFVSSYKSILMERKNWIGDPAVYDWGEAFNLPSFINTTY